jgi:serine/threonine-protein kinase
MDIRPGVVFGRYTIERELGRGGMGRVLLATDGVLHRNVALKILLPGLLSKEQIVARFFREARLAAQLTHPNTVHVYDLGEIEGHPFIAMEFVDGKPLTAYLGDSHIAVARRLRWLIDVAKGLGAAHARGLLHRDMKPANVMVSTDDVAKVVDFGLAKKEVARSTRHDLAKVAQQTTPDMGATFQTATGFVVGTPAYMAPEQLEGVEAIDARADQFGWALTAYALILGQNLRKLDPLLFGPIPLLSDRVPEVPRRAAEIVLRALSNDREMRFPSMDALVMELEAAIAMRASAPPRTSRTPVEPPPPVSQQLTPLMPNAPQRPFCSDCGMSFAMSSPNCKGPHAAALPKPPGGDDDARPT